MPDKIREIRTYYEQAVEAARAQGVTEIEAIVTVGDHALTRFANNTIHQNVTEREAQLSVRPVIDGRTARASTNRLDREGVQRVVDEAIAMTRLTEADPDLLPLAEKGEYEYPNRCFPTTATATPEERARAVAEAIRVVEGAGQTAAGIYSTGISVLAVMNSRGVTVSHTETMARFSITAMAADSSGWAKASACSHGSIDAVQLAQTAARKAGASTAPRELAPGRYTVILEPAAVLDLAGQMFGDFSATAVRDGRSFLNDRIGKKLFGDNITIHDDALDPQQSGAPFDGEGVPRRRLTLVERGVIREVAYCRQAAAKAGVEATGHGFHYPTRSAKRP